EEARRRAGEGVDRLRDVANDADLAPVPDPQVEEALLERGDVLVLVDDEVAVLLADLGRDVLTLAEDADHEQEDVLEVDDPPFGLDVLVDAEEARDGRE